MKTIGLSGIIFERVCGFGNERKKPQKILIDLEIETNFLEVAQRDNPDYGIDFKTIYNHISLALEEEVYTIESIVYRIWKQLKTIDNAGRVKVRVRKPNPPLPGEVEFSEAAIEE
ncbi:dihydroneopterin aldolase [candidate division WOR-3 bacterium]|nr:dihydroneopterin aldolase [candidate division WOR-3 bacterium]MCK4525774.1 dihydroneopterin aldolase [candidate division WOR-3 bacterium]